MDADADIVHMRCMRMLTHLGSYVCAMQTGTRPDVKRLWVRMLA